MSFEVESLAIVASQLHPRKVPDAKNTGGVELPVLQGTFRRLVLALGHTATFANHGQLRLKNAANNS